jgi:hypothetical protein
MEKGWMSYLNHLESATSLVTPYEEIRAGFVSLALEKNRQATPFVEQARALKIRAEQVGSARELINIPDLRSSLLTAAGVSDKAFKHLNESDKTNAILGLIENFLEPAGEDYVEELVYRFLLTRGDSLGGSMRNIGGALAERKISRAIISALTISDTPYFWMDKTSKSWYPQSLNDVDIELRLRGLSWDSSQGSRTVIYNLNVPTVRKNIDICLFDCHHTVINQDVYRDENRYVALGELKGGIDPAGADEHWKTANSALNRIRSSFGTYNLNPHTFFIGAAVEVSMANEIWIQLETGVLENAANLTQADQVASLCSWFVQL